MMDIILDFDQTIVVGPYPSMDEIVPGAIEGVKLLKEHGYKIILNTFRADIGMIPLQNALSFLKQHDIMVDDFYDNKFKPGAFNLKGIPRFNGVPINVKIYIDDISPGIPKIGNGLIEYVDWERVINAFKKEGLL